MILENNFYIVTGGPGAGKTTLIEGLAQLGYNCVPEVARTIIQAQLEQGGNALPWGDTKAYSTLMLKYSVADFKKNSGSTVPLFFDRGIPDTYGYEKLMGFGYNRALEYAANEFRYNKMVFILPPWPEIYNTDNERKQDYAEAVDTYNIMLSVYGELGYNLIRVPKMAVGERVAFVVDKMTAGTDFRR